MEKNFFLILIVPIILVSCSRDIMKTEGDAQSQISPPLTIEKAKNWYDEVLSPDLRNADGNSDGGMKLKPLLNWDLAELNDNSLWTVVELPWEYENAVVEVASSEVRESGADVRFVERLVIMQDKRTGEMYGFKMLVLPDLEYMLVVGDRIDDIKYLQRDAGFRGMILFYDMDGSFVNGWRYSDDDSASEDDGGQSTLRSSDGYELIEYCRWQKVSTDGGNTWSEPILLGCTYFIEKQTLPVDGGTGGGGFNNMFVDSPVGGGGNSNNTNGNTNPDPVVPASEADINKVFNTSDLDNEEKKIIQDLLDKIVKDCLGKAVYNGLVSSLNGKIKLTIQLIPGDKSNFSISGTSTAISKAGINLGKNLGSNSLFHEMWHGYQAFQEMPESFVKNQMNLEMEAQYVQYLYQESLPEYEGSDWEKMLEEDQRRKAIKDIGNIIDKKGNLLTGKSENDLKNHINDVLVPIFQKDNAYKDYPFNPDRVGLNNFKNLSKLSINCK